jgi:hypothetical protein
MWVGLALYFLNPNSVVKLRFKNLIVCKVTVNLSLCLIKRLGMQTYGEVEARFHHLYLGT